MLLKSTYVFIVPIVVFLTFEKASYINGQTTVADGGATIDLRV